MSHNSSVPSPAQLIDKYQLNAKKSLGQNFILDLNFTDKIVRCVNDLSKHSILEIGAGAGTLTRSILEANPKKLVVIEKDQRCIELLNELKSHYRDKNFEIIHGDAIKINELEIFADEIKHQEKFKIIANLPYNIGSVLLIKWLKISQHIASMHLMLQKEVVERIIAKTNDNHFGRLAVMANFYCHTKMLFTVHQNVFTPPPKILSAIVELIPNAKIDPEIDFEKLERVVANAFSQRRKMLKSSLKNLLANETIQILENCQINPKLRAEQLTITDFIKLTKAITIRK